MRPGRLDITVRTGQLWARDVSLWQPVGVVQAAEVLPEQRIFFGGKPMLVYSVTPTSAARVTIAFNQGLIHDPTVSLPADGRVQLADMTLIEEAEAAYTYDGDADESTSDRIPIPTTIAADGLSVLLSLDVATTSAMADGPANASWDLYAKTAAFDWQPVLEGTLSVIRGDAR